MKICQLVLSRGDGGLEKHVRELSQQQLAAGHEVSVIADKQFLASLPAGIGRFPVEAGLGRLNPVLNFAVLRRLQQIKPDIVHAQANKAASVLSHLRRFSPAITVGTLHNIKRQLRAYKRLDHVITVSRQLAASFAADKHSVIYNGIETARNQQRDLYNEFQLDRGKPVLLAVGRLVKAKGFDVLLDAVDGLDINLLIIGDGPEQQALNSQCAKMQANTRVCFAGQRRDVTSLMAGADGILISSRREGFSYVFSEALMAGCPVLATDVPVANEVLPADLITPVDDAASFRQRLVSLLAGPQTWSQLMTAPRQIAINTMTLEAMSQQTLATYQRLLAQRPC